MKIVDLSMIIQPHWRWNVGLNLAMEHSKGDPCQATVASLPMHAFTHIDTPLHIEPDRITMEEVELDSLCGPAAVVDLAPKEANEPITVDELKAKGGHIAEGDIVILKTDWDLKRDYLTREYWLEAPYVEEEAAAWLADQPIKAVGFDFPQDYTIREIPGRHPGPEEMPTHHLILRKGIYLFEYLCNVHQLTSPRATVFGMPIKVKGAEGAPARIAAVMD